MKIGNTSFNPLAFKDTSKKDFKAVYDKKMGSEKASEAYDLIQKSLKDGASVVGKAK